MVEKKSSPLFSLREDRARLMGYALAPVSVAGCVMLRYFLGGVLHDRGRLITFTLAVAVSAIVGGWGPGLLATLLSIAAGLAFFTHPPTSLLTHPPELALTSIFLVNSLVMCWLSGSRDRASRAARSLNRQLEGRVAERTVLAEQKASALEASQRQIREQAELLGSILDSIGDAVMVVDDSGRALHFNPATHEVFGHGDHAQIAVIREGNKISLGNLLRESNYVVDQEVIFPREAGAQRWLTVNVHPLAGGLEQKPHGAVAVFHDITHRKNAEIQIRGYQQKLRALASELTLAEQRERRRIAVDLHDHIAHLLVMCKLRLSPLCENAKQAGRKEEADTLEQIKTALDEAIGYTRSLIFRLSPPVLYELGLEAAIEWLAGQFRSQHDLIVEIRDDKLPKPLGEDVRAALFQSVRELLFNVVKHARCDRATVTLSRADGNIRVTTQDTGSGFDPNLLAADPHRPGGMGLFSIRERIDLLGGTVEVFSAPGRGARITLTAPLNPAAIGATAS